MADLLAIVTGGLLTTDISAPSVPSLTVADQADGTGATATVSGGDATATHTVKYAAYGSTSWTEGGSRTGNGTVDLAITTLGYYWAVCEAEENGATAVSAPVAFAVTAGTESLLEQVMDAVAAELNGLGLTDSADASIAAAVEIPPDFDSVTTACVKIFPDTAPLDVEPGTANRGVYRVHVALCQEATTSAQENNLMLNREKIQDRLVGSRLSGLSSAVCLGMAEPAVANLEWLWNNWRWVSLQTFEFARHRART